ncbi:MAG: HPr family phosphocarrier protein [Spirochaetales bacterium]|nr:HPr family phosphocarrier protein [Spirochaetales bacterium]
MVRESVTVTNEEGLHTRPGNRFVKEAKKYASDITVRKGDKTANAKSMLKLLKVGISKGDVIEIVAEGDDEKTAVAELVALIARLGS